VLSHHVGSAAHLWSSYDQLQQQQQQRRRRRQWQNNRGNQQLTWPKGSSAPVEVVQVNCVDPQALQRRLTRLAHVFPTALPYHLAVLDDDAALGGDCELFALALDGFACNVR
jgi:hypothetical protein